MFNKNTIRDINVHGKQVLVRVDFNVPINDGMVGDDTRIRAALPTIEYLLEKGAAVILCSHLGRPKGSPKPELSLKPVADYLNKLISGEVSFVENCVGPKAETAAKALQPGQVLLLENTRFNPGETANDTEMAKQLASLADIYVNDAFGSAHRAHASTEGVAHFLPSAAGFLMENEIRFLGKVLEDPERPFITILGGAKISDKIGVIRNLLGKADAIMIGGGMANTFFKAQGFALAESLVEDDVLETARELIKKGGERIQLPVDVVIADEFAADAQIRTMPVGDVPDGWRVLDIGPDTVMSYSKRIKKARTIVWNGPMGVFEFETFAEGTNGIARAVAESDAVSIVGGGESVAAIKKSGIGNRITHISTGGGASLEMLEGLVLPGVAALSDN